MAGGTPGARCDRIASGRRTGYSQPRDRPEGEMAPTLVGIFSLARTATQRCAPNHWVGWRNASGPASLDTSLSEGRSLGDALGLRDERQPASPLRKQKVSEVLRGHGPSGAMLQPDMLEPESGFRLVLDARRARPEEESAHDSNEATQSPMSLKSRLGSSSSPPSRVAGTLLETDPAPSCLL
jgi:hypothetical protein